MSCLINMRYTAEADALRAELRKAKAVLAETKADAGIAAAAARGLRVMRSLSPLYSLLLLLTGAAMAAADPWSTDCPSDTNYTRGGVFQANLDAFLSFLPAAASDASGLAENTTGTAPDEAYGLAHCRADVNASECRSCLDTWAWDQGFGYRMSQFYRGELVYVVTTVTEKYQEYFERNL
uniref:Gnk2-homologous domain-containing protein n=1 Tax=Aegilops tauschii subsp. strangulata TaxID=200361 RepID=A0A453SMW7_AEGTS